MSANTIADPDREHRPEQPDGGTGPAGARLDRAGGAVQADQEWEPSGTAATTSASGAMSNVRSARAASAASPRGREYRLGVDRLPAGPAGRCRTRGWPRCPMPRAGSSGQGARLRAPQRGPSPPPDRPPHPPAPMLRSAPSRSHQVAEGERLPDDRDQVGPGSRRASRYDRAAPPPARTTTRAVAVSRTRTRSRSSCARPASGTADRERPVGPQRQAGRPLAERARPVGASARGASMCASRGNTRKLAGPVAHPEPDGLLLDGSHGCRSCSSPSSSTTAR